MIDRRRFFEAGLGAGLAPRAMIETTPQPPPRFPPAARTGYMAPRISDYERAFADTAHIEWVGRPRSWSVVKQGFLPVSPDRVRILRSHGRPWHTGSGGRRGLERQRSYDRVCRRLHRGGRECVYDEKLGLIVRILHEITSCYGTNEYLEDWAFNAARREELGSTGIGRQLALPEYVQPCRASTANVPVDWWLFLFPDGIMCWDALDEKPVHVIMLHALSRPKCEMVGTNFGVLCLLSRCARSIDDSGTSLVDVSEMNRIDAARFVNQHAARALRKMEAEWDTSSG